MRESETEREIVKDVQSGDVEAFRYLVERYQGPIYSLMLRSAPDRDTAADLAQETFTRAYAGIGKFDPGKRFFPWLYSIGMNLLRDYLRKSGREFSGIEVDTFSSESSMEDADESMDARTVYKEVLRLPETYREALVLRFREECSMKDIAAALNISVSGAKMRVSRGLEMLRERFGGKGHEE